MGRVGSFAYLNYVTNTADPARAKLFGDAQDKLTTISTLLLFFELELNRIGDEVMDAALRNAELAHYRPWLTDLRKERPYQLSDDLEKLFHEKGMTGPAAWSRLFNETLTGLRFDIDGESYTLEVALNYLSNSNADKRAAAAEALAAVFKSNVRLFTLVMNTLTKDKEISDRWRGFPDVASSRHLANRVEPEVVDALVKAVRESYPRLSHRYYMLKARWLDVDHLNYWDRNAPISRDPEHHHRMERRAPHRDRGIPPLLAAHGRNRRWLLRQELDRRARARGQIAGRVLAPNRAFRASLHHDELPGQTARRDDARP